MILYFDLHIEVYNIEEDAEDPESHHQGYAKSLMNAPSKINALEWKALSRLEKLFDTKISNEGHDSYDSLVCKIHIGSVAQLADIDEKISQYYTGGEDTMDTGILYVEAMDFRFYPGVGQGPVWYGEQDDAEGTIAQFIEGK
tara:strand:- start:2460 stop:2885 length:426 start_codon:yes stop_codon:yes gene_type:complete